MTSFVPLTILESLTRILVVNMVALICGFVTIIMPKGGLSWSQLCHWSLCKRCRIQTNCSTWRTWSSLVWRYRHICVTQIKRVLQLEGELCGPRDTSLGVSIGCLARHIIASFLDLTPNHSRCLCFVHESHAMNETHMETLLYLIRIWKRMWPRKYGHTKYASSRPFHNCNCRSRPQNCN